MKQYKPRFHVAVGMARKKNSSLLKAVSAKHRSKFAALSPVIVRVATNKQNLFEYYRALLIFVSTEHTPSVFSMKIA
jgi:uncharacterized MAPEG superfamily protein